MGNRIISVSVADGVCFFHVMGDLIKYFDTDSLLYAHPELFEFVKEHGTELSMELYRKREVVLSIN
jgi:hypothetical protein